MKVEIHKVFETYNYKIPRNEEQNTLHFFSKERTEVRNLFESLSWLATDAEQQMAVEKLAKELMPCEYVYLILPGKYIAEQINGKEVFYKDLSDKSRWENAAKTLVKIGWPKIEHILEPMFIWLLDPNWPGSEMIYTFLQTLPKNVLLQTVRNILNNPHDYNQQDYSDLKEIIQEMLGSI